MKLIREFDDFEWAKSNVINPWVLGYTGIEFDIEPTRENLNELIEMALSLKMSNGDKWDEDSRESDIDVLIDNFNNGSSYLGVNAYRELGYGPRNDYDAWDDIKWIEYSKLIDNGLNENKEDDGFGWAREVLGTFDENNTPRVGDVLVCLPGYHAKPEYGVAEKDDPNCAGRGYAEGRIIVVGNIDVWDDQPEGKRLIVWPNEKKSRMYWDYDDEVCFDCGVYGFALTYYNNTLVESDEDNGLKWIIDTDPNVPVHFSNVVVGRTYRVEPTEVLYDAIVACEDDIDIYSKAKSVKVKEIDYQIKYSGIFCGYDRDDEVVGLHLFFYDKDGYLIDTFWVADDMVTLYEFYSTINENIEGEDEWSWAKEIEPEIKLEPNTLYYFEPKLAVDEIDFFADNIANAPELKKWLKNLPNVNDSVARDGGIKFLLTNPYKPVRIQTFCTYTSIDYATTVYPGVKVVDARKTFNF